jgi:hypothetical protein
VGAFVPIVSLLVVLALSLLITRIATVALMFTGLSQELARFQARSAFVGVGFTTSESERVMDHPVRRRIVMWLMLLGNAGLIAAVSSLIPVFIGGESDAAGFGRRILLLTSGLLLIWAVSVSKWIDRQMSRAIAWALKRWTHLDVSDYPALLQLSAGYMVSELKVEAGDWVAGKNLTELRLADEGVQVLGIRRATGEYVGAPTGKTYIRRGDTLVLYGLVKHIAEIDQRGAGTVGDAAHEQRVQEQHMTIEEQERQQRTGPRSGNGGPDGSSAATN